MVEIGSPWCHRPQWGINGHDAEGQEWETVKPKVDVGTDVLKSADAATSELKYVSNHEDLDYNPESSLHCYRATIAIDTHCDGDVVYQAMDFHKQGDSRIWPTKSYQQIKSPAGDSLPRHAPTSLAISCARFNISRPSNATMKVTGWAPRWTPNDHYYVNIKFRWLPAARYTL